MTASVRHFVQMPVLFGMLIIMLMGCALFSKASKPGKGEGLAYDDFFKASTYSRYRFGETDRVIDFGMQPLAVPEGIINAVMVRDLILRRALAQRGFGIRSHPFLKGGDLNQFLIRGDIEVAFAGDMPTITAAAKTEIRILGLAKQGYSTIVARHKWLIGDLKGKRIGYVAGSTDHYALIKALFDYGLQPSDVELVPTDLNKMPDAIMRGKIDAFSAREPIPTIVLTRGREFIPIRRMLNTAYCYMPQRFVRQYPEEAKLILASFARAVNWLLENDENLWLACEWTLDAGERFTGTRQKLTPRQMGEIMKRDFLNISGIPLIPNNVLNDNGYIYHEFMFLKTLKKIPNTTSWRRIKDSFDLECLRDILNHPAKYNLTTYAYRMKG